MKSMAGEDCKLLFAKADDLYARARKGAVAVSGFLNPAEAHYLKKYAKENKTERSVVLFGGYRGASRTKAFFLPDYITDLCDLPVGEERDAVLLSYIADDVAAAISAVSIKGSGYRELSHRDYLGSILSLGIERFVVGDIAALDAHSALVFADPKIAEYIVTSLCKVASDDVRCAHTTVPDDFTVEENVEDIVMSVASMRIDCIVGGLTNRPREQAQSLVKSGAVTLDYEEICDTDKRISAPALVSVRGYGKFRVLDNGSETRRGRLRVKAQKFI